ncbi:TPA: sodium:proton exchanger [Candidatus Acetothermia bacterium]|nr:sodium:proton exchanger [Candidatus Acetothermia bacterium]
MVGYWLIFSLTACIVIIAGYKLAAFGDIIAKQSNIGGTWIGLMFLAVITSLPELVTTMTGGAIDAPQIAIGNALGSNLFNIAIIGVADFLLLGRGPLLLKVSNNHSASGALAILLTAVAMVGMTIGPSGEIFRVGTITLMIISLYTGGMWFLYRLEKKQAVMDIGEELSFPVVPQASSAEEGPEERQDKPVEMSFRRAVLWFALCGALIFGAGVSLIFASNEIAIHTGLSASFVGAIMVAVATSLPELVVAVGAIKLGAYDMIIGNMFGSNMFNIATIFFADMAFRRGAILPAVEQAAPDLLVIGALGIALTTIAVAAIIYRSQRRILGVGVSSILILIVYLISIYIIAT